MSDVNLRLVASLFALVAGVAACVVVALLALDTFG
jgi:hypothetical protein